MTEILDPRTKSCTFLTLKDYVGELGKFKRAQCLMEKNEAFMSSENLWIAAESFKISVSPNPQGLVYRMIPPEYFMEAQFLNSTGNNEVVIDNFTVHVTNVSLKDDKNQTVEFGFDYPSWIHNFGIVQPGPMDSDSMLQAWLRDINHYKISKGQKMSSELYTAGDAQNPGVHIGQLGYTLDEDPLQKMRGAEYGDLGLERIEMSYINDHPPNMGAAGGNVQSQYWRVSKKNHPGLTVDLLKTYISTSGRHGCFAYGMARLVNTQPVHAVPTSGSNPYRVAEYVIKGPSVIVCNSALFTFDPLPILYHAQVPFKAIYTKGGPLKVGAKVYQYRIPVGQGTAEEFNSIVKTLANNWVSTDPHNGDFLISIWSQQLDIVNYPNYWLHTGTPLPGDIYHLYQNRGGIDLTDVPIETSLSIKSKITPTFWNQNPITAANALPPQALADGVTTAPYPTQNNGVQVYAPKVYIDDKDRTSYNMRASQTEDIAAYTPSDFFQHFNVFPGGGKPPFRLGQDPNGGFRVNILSDNMEAFSMSKVMIDDLGLNTYLTVPEVITTDDLHESVFKPEVIPLDDENNWYRSYASGSSQINYVAGSVTIGSITASPSFPINYASGSVNIGNVIRTPSATGHFAPHLTVGNMSDYDVCDAAGTITGPLDPETPLGSFLLSRVDGYKYKLITFYKLKVKEEKISDGKIQGTLLSDGDGNLYYNWTSPPQGSFLSNSQTVSLDSFALFSSIRIVVPDGVIFQPMLAGRSDARILAELRLVFDLGPPQVLQGFGPGEAPEGLLMSTSFTNYGDLLWNSGASKQYLQVTSGNPIYRINCEVRLVYRDPTKEPKVLFLGYNDLFELKLRLIQLQ